MDFVRPEVLQGIARFRDAIAGVGVSLLGFYWAIGSIGFMSIVGSSLVIAGALLVFAGIQRGRFRSATGGAGVVHVDEGQVTYFGPQEGGSVVIADLSKVELCPSNHGAAQWVLYDPATAPLYIPTDAEGADTLFDVFSSLDGLQTEKMLTAMKSRRKKHVVVWQSKPVALH